MEFKAATCERCGAPLSFDMAKQILFCEHCGSTFFIEHDKTDEKADALAAAGKWLKLKNWQKAEECYAKALDLDPMDFDAWYGRLTAFTENFTRLSYFNRRDLTMEHYWRTVLDMGPNDDQFDTMVTYMGKVRDRYQSDSKRLVRYPEDVVFCAQRASELTKLIEQAHKIHATQKRAAASS